MPTLHRFSQNRLALAGLVYVLLMVVVAITAPLYVPYDPLEMAGPRLEGMSAAHWLGTDHMGRDILSRVIYGTRISLQVGLISVSIALAAGTFMGIIAGYFGSYLDTGISRLNDVLLAFPDILLALTIMAVLGESLTNVMIAIGIVYTPIFSRITRGAVLQVRKMPYVEAARALGIGNARILARHILPNVTAPLIVQTTLSFAFAVLAEAGLNYLGLGGLEPGAPSWGAMLQDGKGFMERAWWLAVFPGLAITLAVLSFNVLGDGLRDALDPKLRE